MLDGRDRSSAHGNICRAAMAVLVMLFSRFSCAGGIQVPGEVPLLGAHTLFVQAQGRGTDPAVTSPVTTQADGSSLLVLVGGYASNADAPVDSYANKWKPLGHSVVYEGYQGRFDTRAYVVAVARGGTGHTVSLAKKGAPSGEVTVPFLEIMHAGVVQDVAQNYPAPGVAGRYARKLERAWKHLDPGSRAADASVTSGTVTTTGPATLIAVWWGDAFVYSMTAVPDNGFKVVDSLLDLPPDSAVQCAVAIRQVDEAGTYDVTWTGAPAQGAILWLIAFQSMPKPKLGEMN